MHIECETAGEEPGLSPLLWGVLYGFKVKALNFRGYGASEIKAEKILPPCRVHHRLIEIRGKGHQRQWNQKLHSQQIDNRGVDCTTFD